MKSLKSLNLKGSLEQFSATMTAQTDLRVEAVHLRRFFRNFVAVRASVTPPFPLPGYEAESVLIETFEQGEALAMSGPCQVMVQPMLGLKAGCKPASFFRNFVAVRASVTPPFPLPGYEAESVLIQTFEQGGALAMACPLMLPTASCSRSRGSRPQASCPGLAPF